MIRLAASRLSRRLARWTADLRLTESQLSLVLSVLIGALVGLVVVAFLLLTGRLAAQMYPAGGSGWRRLLVPTVGAALTGFLLHRYFPLARGSGIPQTKAALALHGGRISLRTVVGKFLCCSTSLASGIALGREGPSVHIGAGLASVIGQRIGFGPARIRALIPAGAAAAVAAAFNTPIAGVLFALEEIVGDLHAPVLGSVVLSAATSWMVLHLVLGNEPLFHVTAYQLVNPLEFAVYAVLGVVGGLGSVAFVKLLLRLRRRFLDLPRWSAWFQPVAGGLTVGIMGYLLPDALGVGYPQVERALGGDIALRAVVILALLKIVATAICYASGNAGGVFGPSLFIGAMLGASVGSVAHLVFPEATAGPGAYALVGMGTAFAGIIRTPFTSVIMIFELTRDYAIIVPLMISNLIAYFISFRLQREPIYEALARQDGVHLPVSAGVRGGGMRVSAAMRAPAAVLPAGMRVREALARAPQGEVEAWPIADDEGLRGMLPPGALAEAVADGRGDAEVAALLADDLGRHRPGAAEFPHLHPDHSLTQALERMGRAQSDVLPVVSRENVRRLVGVVRLQDVLSAYGVTRGPGRRDRDQSD